DLLALPNVKGFLAALAMLYLAFSLFSSQLGLVLHARYQWGGEPNRRRTRASSFSRSRISWPATRCATACRFPAGATTFFQGDPLELHCRAWHPPAAVSDARSRPRAPLGVWPR